MSSTTPSRTTPGGQGSSLGRDGESTTNDLRRMAPIYVAVVATETIVLLALWWFQQHFS